MKNFFNIFLISLLLISSLCIGSAQGSLIVDTGNPTNQTQLFPIGNTIQVGFASEFSVGEAYTITSIKAYLFHTGNTSDSLIWSIYSGGGTVPSGSPLYSITFNGPSTPTPTTNYPLGEWWGPSMTWSISKGSYWVVVTSNFPSTAPDKLSIGTFAPSPLGKDACLFNTGWEDRHLWDIGWKIDANPVPIPSAFWLLVSGLLGLVGIRKKF